MLITSTFNGTYSLQSGSPVSKAKLDCDVYYFFENDFAFLLSTEWKFPLLKKQEYAKAMLTHQRKQSMNFPMIPVSSEDDPN